MLITKHILFLFLHPHPCDLGALQWRSVTDYYKSEIFQKVYTYLLRLCLMSLSDFLCLLMPLLHVDWRLVSSSSFCLYTLWVSCKAENMYNHQENESQHTRPTILQESYSRCFEQLFYNNSLRLLLNSFIVFWQVTKIHRSSGFWWQAIIKPWT